MPIKAQVLSRAIGVLLGHELTLNPFYTCASYEALAALPCEARIAQLRRPEVRDRILAESADPDPTIVLGRLARQFDHMFLLAAPRDANFTHVTNVSLGNGGDAAAGPGIEPHPCPLDRASDPRRSVREVPPNWVRR